MTVLLSIGDGNAQIAGFGLTLVNHRRTLHSVGGAVGKKRPMDAVDGSLYLVLIEERSILKLCPHLVEALCASEVYLQPLVLMIACCPIGARGFPKRGIIIVHCIFRFKPVIVIRRGSYFRTKGEVL